MFFSLHSSRRLTAGLAFCFVIFTSAGTITPGYSAVSPKTVGQETNLVVPLSLQTSDLQPTPQHLAHYGLEGCPVAASAILSATAKKAAPQNPVSTSLWGNLLLNMAYQQDTQLQKWMKTMGRVDNFTLLSVAAISSLGVAQSIDTLATLQQDPHPVHPVVLGLVGTGTSIGSLAVRLAVNHHYSKLIAKRQSMIQDQIRGILAQLKEGIPFAHIQDALSSLVGTEATQEFSEIWQATHH